MLATDRDALLCDMAETYGVYDFQALPVATLAALAFGLRPNSRIKMKIAGHKYMTAEELLVCVVDKLAMLPYNIFGKEGDPLPQLLSDVLYEQPKQQRGYASGEEFLKAWNEIE